MCYGNRTGIYGMADHLDSLHQWLPPKEGLFARAWTTGDQIPQYVVRNGLENAKTRELVNFPRANMMRVFGEGWLDAWITLNTARMRSWGVNTLGVGVNDYGDEPTAEFLRKAQMPYVITFKFFPLTDERIFRDFPDVFSPDYERLTAEMARRELRAYRDDPLLIGYFLNNEPTWGFVEGILLAERVLENGQGTATLRELIAFLRQRYGEDISALNRAWRLELPDFETLEKGLFRAAERSPEAERDLSDFTGQMIDRYAGLPAQYAREVAPRHLNLGMRFAHVNHPGMLRAARHFDVFSLNCYAADPTEALLAVQKALDMPVLIGEFHFGALDAGLPAPSLFHVKDQKARGDAYARYLTRAAAQPCSVGAHYFAYNDQPLWGRYDGENYQFGFVDVCNRPYEPFGEGVRRANEEIYRVKEGLAAPEGGETQRES